MDVLSIDAPMDSNSSRRQRPRTAINVSFSGGAAATNLSGRITDLSPTGVFIATPQFIPIGKQVHLEFELATGRVEAVGEVRWVARGADAGEPGLGIRFVRLSSGAAQAIEEACR